ncbi:S-formylglutathione hydrolase, partial [hydrothermal vent metagenome]
LSAPMSGPWGQNALSRYLGADKNIWKNHDSSYLIKHHPSSAHLLVDQGLADQFLQAELFPHMLEEAAKSSGQKLTLRRHEGYDHSYYFIQTFMEDHLRHHAEALND